MNPIRRRGERARLWPVSFTFRITTELDLKIREEAARNQTTMGDVVRDILFKHYGLIIES